MEIDLRVSKDGVIFAFHDDSIGERPVAEMLYAEISRSAHSAAPTLSSILEHGHPHGYFVLDLKETDATRYRSLAASIAEAGIPAERFLVQGKNVDVLAAVQSSLPEASFYFLADLKRRAPFFRAPRPETVIARIRNADLDGVSLKGRRFIDSLFVERIREAGYRVYVWTINDVRRAAHYRDIGVDGLITDELEGVRSMLETGQEEGAACFGDGA